MASAKTVRAKKIKPRRAPAEWLPLFAVAALMAGDKVAEFRAEYESRLRTGSDASACWGALKKVGLPEESRALQEMLDAVPSRRAQDGTREVLWRRS